MTTPDQKNLTDSPEAIEDLKMPLVEHLRELRRRLLVVFITVFVAFIIAWGFSGEILEFLKAPVAKYGKLQFDTVSDPFFTHMKASFYAALFFTFPLTIWQIWLFVGPGLYKQEKKIAWPFLLLSFPLFVGGGLFCFAVVFPAATDFLINFDHELIPSLRIGDYLSFVLQMILVFGLIFELPLISLLLTRIGVLTPTFLHKNRRYSIVLIFVIAAILTPTPDVYTQMLMAVPLMVLYEVSLLVSWLALPRKPKVKADPQP